MTLIQDAISATEDLSVLLVKKAKLLDQLALSLALQAFEPRAFAGGSCRITGSSNSNRPWEGTITIHLPTGEDVPHRAADVPFKLWPVPMQEELHRIAANKRPVHLRDLK